ncbi:MAG TPA: TetR/AcrR family transcriptional regulator [Candidatus Limosilactobacillus intestinigallinarum]|nr:TetR/AcrR family transcriptional regulator [Candidatus Limosilactobacillus intestinigallinarum]
MKVKDDNKRKLLLEVVADIITESGIESVSMSKVAKRAHLSIGTAYTYFKNKQDLLYNVYLSKRRHYNDYLLDHISKNGDAETKLNSYVRNLYNYGTEYYKNLSLIDSVVNSHLRAKFFPDAKEPHDMVDPWTNIIKQGIQEGVFTEIDPYGAMFFAYHNVVNYIKDIHYENYSAQSITIDEIASMIIKALKVSEFGHK